MITRIRIPARWQEPDEMASTGVYRRMTERSDVADFKLGLGPCGKVVISLDCKLNSDYVMVCQITDDGEQKDFYYPIATVTGRVEITENA